MIVKQGNKYVVKSEDGSKRLQQVEYFKHVKQTHQKGR